MVGSVQCVNSQVNKMAVTMQSTQASFANLHLNRKKTIIIKINCRMKFCLTILACGKNTVSYQNMVMDVIIKTAEGLPLLF